MRRIEKYDESLTSEVITVAAALAILFSVYLAISAIIGSLSVIKESYLGIIFYTVLLVISLGIMIGLGIWAIVQVDYVNQFYVN